MEGVTLELPGRMPAQLSLSSAQVDLSTETIEGQVVNSEFGQNGEIKLTGDSSRWDLNTGVMTFQGSVELRHGELELRCDHLEAVYVDQTLSQATAMGQVVVEKAGVVATGAQAVWSPKLGSVTLTGTPVLTDHGRNLRGREIVLYVDERRLECLDCTLSISDIRLK
jgi:lipopolysaccharide transport protein LptA